MSETLDDYTWHSEGDFPDDLAPERGATHIGVYLAWAVLRGYAAPELLAAHPGLVERLRSGSLTPSALLLETVDGELLPEHFIPEVGAFSEYYYDEEYLDDYVELSDDTLPSIYHEPDTAAKIDQIARMLDRRYEAFTAVDGPRFH